MSLYSRARALLVQEFLAPTQTTGFEVVRVLAAPLDLVVVGKIGAPFEAELAIGAIADGADPELVTDPLFIAGLDIAPGPAATAPRVWTLGMRTLTRCSTSNPIVIGS